MHLGCYVLGNCGNDVLQKRLSLLRFKMTVQVGTRCNTTAWLFAFLSYFRVYHFSTNLKKTTGISPKRSRINYLVGMMLWKFQILLTVFGPAVHIQVLLQLLHMYGLRSCMLRPTFWLFSLN